MKKILFPILLLVTSGQLFSQDINKIINAQEVERIEKVLSSDDMRGRRVFSPEIDKAADFIAAEFKSAGLETWNKSKSFRQEFSMIRPKFISVSATLDGVPVDPENVVVITCHPDLKVDEHAGFEIVSAKINVSLTTQAGSLTKDNKNYLVMVDSSGASNFPRLAFLKRALFKTGKSIVFILGNKIPSTFSIEAKHEISEDKLANVVGIIPGKSRKDEYVIFSGHYDHLGVSSRSTGSDSIYNGANDNASGVTAMMLLAKYYKELNNNERTLIFAAFTGEESGGYGSRYFSNQFDPAKVMAMFNIEMIGSESKWGKNSAYITGFELSDMGPLLQKNLDGSQFSFYPDPYTDKKLFYRSDNATLARLGVPAHTISTSKMDNEPNYHKVTDEISTLDLENMSMIIRSIALSAKTIVNGKDTPARVKPEELTNSRF